MSAFCVLFFFFFHAFWQNVVTVHVLFIDPEIPLFSNFFIKNGSHGTIYTFKNYFATVISAISFQFQQNKSYPNRPLMHQIFPKAKMRSRFMILCQPSLNDFPFIFPPPLPYKLSPSFIPKHTKNHLASPLLTSSEIE